MFPRQPSYIKIEKPQSAQRRQRRITTLCALSAVNLPLTHPQPGGAGAREYDLIAFFTPWYEKVLPSRRRTRMTRIGRIFTDTFNPCASVSSVKSVFYRTFFIVICAPRFITDFAV